MNVFMVHSGYDGCSYVRIFLPAVHNGFRMDKTSRTSERLDMEKIKENLAWADVVVFHRPEDETYLNLSRLLRRDGKKIVMDNDDTFRIEDYHPLADFSPDGFQQNIRKRNEAINTFIGFSDMVTTTTEFLAQEYRKLNSKVVVLPNYIDPMDWDEPLRNETGKVRIGMIGSVSIEYDYLHVKDLLRELSKREDVTIVLFGLGDAKHRADNPAVTRTFREEYDFWDSIKHEQVPWCKNYLYQEKLNEARLDMMLIPRRDNYFNRCKSNIKFLEASMLEIPCIAQGFSDNLSPYQGAADSRHMKIITDSSKWYGVIDEMIRNKKERMEVGKEAHEYVLKNYNIEEHYQEWQKAYEKLYAYY
jgi:glycosyltransferase involved in cell wall biosynthesis